MVEGNPRIIRDLVESWDEPPLDISAASSTAGLVQQAATAASGFTKDAPRMHSTRDSIVGTTSMSRLPGPGILKNKQKINKNNKKINKTKFKEKKV